MLWISVITLKEVLNGTLHAINTARKHPIPERLELLYKALHDVTERLTRFNILEYTAEDERQWARWAQNRITTGRTMDCRIAASALRKGFMVITCNTRDFKEIPGLKW